MDFVCFGIMILMFLCLVIRLVILMYLFLCKTLAFVLLAFKVILKLNLDTFLGTFLQRLHSLSNLPWLIVGAFNEILLPDEKTSTLIIFVILFLTLAFLTWVWKAQNSLGMDPSKVRLCQGPSRQRTYFCLSFLDFFHCVDC